MNLKNEFIPGVLAALFVLTSSGATFPCSDFRCHTNSVCNITINQCECPTNRLTNVSQIYCGSDGLEYSSRENLESIACQLNKTIHPVKKGACYACGRLQCPAHMDCLFSANVCMCKKPANTYNPVCGSDGKDYDSPSILQAKACFEGNNVTIAYKGFCKGPGVCGHHKCHVYSVCDPVTNECKCAEVINSTRALVCGSDGQTYENIFMLQAHSCLQNMQIECVHNGKCDTVPLICEHTMCHYYGYCNYTTNKCVCPGKVNHTEIMVCGSDRKNYENIYELRRLTCLRNSTVYFSHKGPCVSGKDKASNWHVIVIPVVVVVLVLFLLVVIGCFIYRKKKRRSTKSSSTGNQDNDMALLS